MRTAALIAAAAAAFTLTACNQPDKAATDAPMDGSTEATEASGAAADTSAMGTEPSAMGAPSTGKARSGSGSGAMSGETMDPASGSMPSDGAMTPGARAPAADDNVTETDRRLNPPQNAPAQ